MTSFVFVSGTRMAVPVYCSRQGVTRLRVVILPIHSALVRHIWVLGSVLGSPAQERHEWSKSSERSQRRLKDWSICHKRWAWESWDCTAWRREESGDLTHWHEYLLGLGWAKSRWQSQTLMPSDRSRGNCHNLKHRKFHLNIFSKADQTLTQVAQRGCEISVLGVDVLLCCLPSSAGIVSSVLFCYFCKNDTATLVSVPGRIHLQLVFVTFGSSV